MDTLSEVLDNVRSAGALLGQNLMSPPWSVRFDEGASMTLLGMLRGEGWLRTAGADPVPLGTGNLAIIVGAEPFEVTSERAGGVRPLYIQSAAGTCTDSEGQPIDEDSISLGVRICGNDLEGENTLLTGSYIARGRVSDRLLDALPRVVLVPRDDAGYAPLQLLEAEVVREDPGQQAVLGRLLDLVLAGTLRDWFALPGVTPPAWYSASADAVVGPALGAIHEDPSRRWSVGELAGTAQVSRATFARRFQDLMGEGPISYLTSWRLCLAADLLTDTDATLETIARQVGYSNPYALSTAFAREYGIRPSAHRSRGAMHGERARVEA